MALCGANHSPISSTTAPGETHRNGPLIHLERTTPVLALQRIDAKLKGTKLLPRLLRSVGSAAAGRLVRRDLGLIWPLGNEVLSLVAEPHGLLRERNLDPGLVQGFLYP